MLLDQLLHGKTGPLVGDRVDRMLAVLADAKDVWLVDTKVTTSGEPVLPQATITDDGPAVVLAVERDPAVTEVVAIGVARCGSVSDDRGDGARRRTARAHAVEKTFGPRMAALSARPARPRQAIAVDVGPRGCRRSARRAAAGELDSARKATP